MSLCVFSVSDRNVCCKFIMDFSLFVFRARDVSQCSETFVDCLIPGCCNATKEHSRVCNIVQCVSLLPRQEVSRSGKKYVVRVD